MSFPMQKFFCVDQRGTICMTTGKCIRTRMKKSACSNINISFIYANKYIFLRGYDSQVIELTDLLHLLMGWFILKVQVQDRLGYYPFATSLL
jgi:hypothetical protein